MAFGDEKEVVEVEDNSSTTITATYATATPAVDDLNIANHFTGDDVSNVDTSGFTEDQLLTNSVENDEGAIYSQKVEAASDNTVTCSSIGADEQMLIFVLVGGTFASSPKDLSDSSGRTTADPATIGVSVEDISQADEYMNAIFCVRATADFVDPWNRLGDAEPTSDMTEYTGDGVRTQNKRLEAAGQVLTAIGTVGLDRVNAQDDVVLIGYATYKMAPLEPGLPEYGQGRAAIGEPAVYGAVIVRS